MSIPARSSPRPQVPPSTYKQRGPCRLWRYPVDNETNSRAKGIGRGCSRVSQIPQNPHQARVRPRGSFYSNHPPPLWRPSHAPSSNYIRRVSSLPGTESSLSARKRQGLDSPRLYESLVPLLAWPAASRHVRASERASGQALELEGARAHRRERALPSCTQAVAGAPTQPRSACRLQVRRDVCGTRGNRGSGTAA
jgi:hypothetical protein